MLGSGVREKPWHSGLHTDLRDNTHKHSGTMWQVLFANVLFTETETEEGRSVLLAGRQGGETSTVGLIKEYFEM